MTILLYRHAHAGDRDGWEGDDRRRPLSSLGLRQAVAAVEAFADHPVDRIVSSPYDRCVASVEPLAAALDLIVETDEALTEGAPLDRTRRLLRRPGGRCVVLCSHGDVIGNVVLDLQRRGHLGELTPHWPKASTWVLDGRLWRTEDGVTEDRGSQDRGDEDRGNEDGGGEVSYLAPPA